MKGSVRTRCSQQHLLAFGFGAGASLLGVSRGYGFSTLYKQALPQNVSPVTASTKVKHLRVVKRSTASLDTRTGGPALACCLLAVAAAGVAATRASCFAKGCRMRSSQSGSWRSMRAHSGVEERRVMSDTERDELIGRPHSALYGECPAEFAREMPSMRCAMAALVSSAKSACVHPDREFPYLCGDCPRNGKAPGSLLLAVKPCAAAAFISTAKSTCVHPDREFPNLCGDCPRNPKKIASANGQKNSICAVAALVSTVKSTCLHPDRDVPYLCGDCPRN